MTDIVDSWLKCPLAYGETTILPKGSLIPPWLFRIEDGIGHLEADCHVHRFEHGDYEFRVSMVDHKAPCMFHVEPSSSDRKTVLCGMGRGVVLAAPFFEVGAQ